MKVDGVFSFLRERVVVEAVTEKMAPSQIREEMRCQNDVVSVPLCPIMWI